MRYLYPMSEYPYADLATVNGERSQQEREYELEDTGVFDNDRYWDVTMEYAKADANDILIKVTVVNNSDTEETIHVIPQVRRAPTRLKATLVFDHYFRPSMVTSRALHFSVSHPTLCAPCLSPVVV
jgi:hypothetical protein